MNPFEDYPVQYERERRFLVGEHSIVRRASWNLITQGYFFSQDGYALRVRVRQVPEDHTGTMRYLDAHVAAKGPRIGDEREEYQADMDPLTAAEFVKRCENVITKRRYQVVLEDEPWEIDEFLGENSGLWIAELEGGNIRDTPIPKWAFKEITPQRRFNNEELAFHPISTWDNTDWKPESPWDWA